MIRYLILLINAVIALLISFFVHQNIELKMGVPEQVKAGEEFHVLLTLDKGALESFSRYQQDLPYGLTAERISTTNADFSFENQRVRIIWLKLPKDDQITISYKIKVDKRLKGSFDLSAEFSYIEGNERKNITFNTSHPISIIPDPQLSVDQLIDIQDYQKQFLSQLKKNADGHNLSITRKISGQTLSGNTTVELFIKKGDLNKFAKIEEYIPDGYSASEIDTENGVFSFENNTIKILWMNLPENNEFSIKYNLLADKNKKPEDLKISGSFSYIDGNQTKILEIAEIEPDHKTIATNEQIKYQTNTDNNVKTVPVNEKVEEVVKPTTKTQVSEKKMVAGMEKIKSDELYILQPETGVYFRVQLAAGHKPIDIQKYFTQLAIKEDVKLEFHEGWRKYSVGSFKEYKEARDYRNLIWKNTRINDAFVSAYNTGKRITVQEALMLSSQKWYR